MLYHPYVSVFGPAETHSLTADVAKNETKLPFRVEHQRCTTLDVFIRNIKCLIDGGSIYEYAIGM